MLKRVDLAFKNYLFPVGVQRTEAVENFQDWRKAHQPSFAVYSQELMDSTSVEQIPGEGCGIE